MQARQMLIDWDCVTQSYQCESTLSHKYVGERRLCLQSQIRGESTTGRISA